MLFTIDVGNTNITCGIFNKENEVKETFRITTKVDRTDDEFGMLLCEMVTRQGYKIEDIKGIIIASVVPNIQQSIANAVEKYFRKSPMIVGPGIKTGIKIDTPNPKEIGADRIVDIVGAYELYSGPALVIDYGTATTYDLVTEDGRFNVGITAPGIRMSAKALWEDTAKLPAIEIVMPKSILANETIWSMQAGLMYGQLGQTEFIIKQVKKETGFDNMKVIATGGLGKLISDQTDMIDEYNEMLTLEGLRLIYEKNR